MSARHIPRIKGGRPAPPWMVEHGELNMHALGPPAEVLAEWKAAGLTLPDLPAMRRYRIDRVREQLRAHDCDAALLQDPLNIRYATDTTNMSLWTMHNHVRYAFVATDGPMIVFEFSDGEFLDMHSEVVDEVRPGVSLHPFYTGDRLPEFVEKWADEIVDLLVEHGRGGRRLAVDAVPLEGIRAFDARSVELVSGHPLMEEARLIKSDDELLAMRCSIDACQRDIAEMRAILEPGITELALWARLQEANYRRGGEWVETRLLSSGARTNPWYQEVSSKVVEAGELVAFDTDMIGPYGMCVDMSRTWLCGGGAPSAAQADLHARAVDMVESNRELFVPGATLRDITANFLYPPVDDYFGYTVLAHGVGLCDEYPSLFTREKWETNGFDDVVEVGHVYSVEAFVGRRDGGEGVKLEDHVVVTDHGPELMTLYPLDLV
ncbi:MAG: M24 family metallopeptidase [Ilumatobacteraceae bacterium]